MSKRKGTRSEHKAMRILESAGYHCTRAAGSFGVFDIIAIGSSGVRLIQVKANRGCSPAEREAIELFDALPPNATKEIWLFKDYVRQPIIKIVRRAGAAEQADWVLGEVG